MSGFYTVVSTLISLLGIPWPLNEEVGGLYAQITPS